MKTLLAIFLLIPSLSWSEEIIKKYPKTLDNYFIFNGPEENSEISLTEFTYFLDLCSKYDFSYKTKLNLKEKTITLVDPYNESDMYFREVDSITPVDKIPIYNNPGRYTIGYREVFKWEHIYEADKFTYAFNGFIEIVWLDLDENGQPQSIGCDW